MNCDQEIAFNDAPVILSTLKHIHFRKQRVADC
jgi:hypothetical protein